MVWPSAASLRLDRTARRCAGKGRASALETHAQEIAAAIRAFLAKSLTMAAEARRKPV
jgi:hypothetical protein